MKIEYIHGAKVNMSRIFNWINRVKGKNKVRTRVIEVCKVLSCYAAAVAISLLIAQLH